MPRRSLQTPALILVLALVGIVLTSVEASAAGKKIFITKTDENFNGQAGVSFELYQDTDKDGVLDPGEPKLDTKVTDATGKATFENVAAGDHIVHEVAPAGYKQPPDEAVKIGKKNEEIVFSNTRTPANHRVNNPAGDTSVDDGTHILDFGPSTAVFCPGSDPCQVLVAWNHSAGFGLPNRSFTTTALSQDSGDLWGDYAEPPTGPNALNLGEPSVIYDPTRNRWVVASAAIVNTGSGLELPIFVSTSGGPFGFWNNPVNTFPNIPPDRARRGKVPSELRPAAHPHAAGRDADSGRSPRPLGTVAAVDGWRLRQAATRLSATSGSLLTCTFGKSTKNPPSSPTRFRTFAVFVWVEMAVTRTWLAARPPRRRRPNRHRQPDAEATGSTAIARQAQGLRGGERRERRSSDPGHLKGGALGGYGSYATPKGSEPAEAKRLRKGSPVGDGATADGLLERPRPDAYGGRPWRRAREMSAGTNTNPSTVVPPASRAAVRRGKGAGHALLDAYGEAPPGLPAPSSSTARPADRIVASHRGEDGESRVPRSTFAPPRSTRVRLRSPVQDLWREVRESLPPRG